MMSFISFLMISAQAFAGDYYLNPGEQITLGSNKVFCREGQVLPVCEENCQHFDKFNNKCNYETNCSYQGNCLYYKNCEQWDSFNSKCDSEKIQITCQAGLSCQETCQYFDSRDRDCKYRTKCEQIGKCIKSTRCSEWDSFSQVCNAESTRTACAP